MEERTTFLATSRINRLVSAKILSLSLSPLTLAREKEKKRMWMVEKRGMEGRGHTVLREKRDKLPQNLIYIYTNIPVLL